MILTIWSSKGGVGKTSIAVEIADRLKSAIITNEANTRVPLFSFLKDKYYVLEHNQTISELTLPTNVIFDFGGMVDPRVLEAVELSKYILIPVTPSMIDVQKCAEDIEGILTSFKSVATDFSEDELSQLFESLLNKFVIIINKNIMEDESVAIINQITNILTQSGINHKFTYFTVPESRALKNMHAEMQSITQMIASSQSSILLARSYKKINTVFNEIIQFITK